MAVHSVWQGLTAKVTSPNVVATNCRLNAAVLLARMQGTGQATGLLSAVKPSWKKGVDGQCRLWCTSSSCSGNHSATVCMGMEDDSQSSSVLQASLQEMRRSGVIACLRTSSADLALDAARAALDGGINVLEVTMTTPSAAEVIKVLVQEYPSALIGAGTVLSMQQAQMAKNAGAKFLMSPVMVKEMVLGHKDGPVLFIPGAMTPTEVVGAYNLGALVVKLYPVALIGGVRFVQALSRPLAYIPLIASNGISLDMVEPYLTAGAMAVILSDAVFDKSALESRDFDKIKLCARMAISK